MAWFMDTYSMHVRSTTTAIVTGKPLSLGGSRGRTEATGRGVMLSAREAIKKLGLRPEQARVVVQGSGNVGGIGAMLMHREGYRVIALSDMYGTMLNEKGLDVPAVLAHLRATVPHTPSTRPSPTGSATRSVGRRAGPPPPPPPWKPALILKGGMIAAVPMGDPNASIPTPQPVHYRLMFGALGRARDATCMTFLSQAARAAGVAEQLGLRKRIGVVRNCRSIGKADMVHNDALPMIEVDPQTYQVRADGQLLTCEPATVLPMAQRYFLF